MVYKWLINNLSRLARHECLLCDETFTPDLSAHICNACCHDLPTFRQVCGQCGINITSSTYKCGPCLTRPPEYDRVVAPFAYAEPIRQLIAHFKFQRQLAIGNVFTEPLISKLNQSPIKVQAIVAVPLHSSRLRQRGFNQALELARPLAKAFKLPLLINEVERRMHTEEQSSLSGRQRRANLKNAFALIKPVNYESIAIVDDVMTTGSTVDELSKLLKKNGVKYIEIWCVARAGQGQ